MKPFFKAIQRILSFIIAFSILAGAGYAADPTVKLPPYTKVQLKNGMTVLLLEKHGVPLISMTVLLKTGSATDPKGKEGLAAITADLLKKGTKSRSS